jgi:hypothetical protein
VLKKIILNSFILNSKNVHFRIISANRTDFASNVLYSRKQHKCFPLYSWLPAIALLMPPFQTFCSLFFFPGEIFLGKPSLDGGRAAPPENNNRYDPTAVYN